MMNLELTSNVDLALARMCVEASARAYAEVSFESELAHVLVVPATTAAPMIIAFRGSADVRAWLTDLRIGFTSTPFGRVHAGFWQSTNSVIADVLDLPQVRAAVPVVVTGHSKGAAEAVICARLLAASGKPVEAVHTFGKPRVGDAMWRAGYNAALGSVTTRWEHEEDIVTRMAAWLTGYRHEGLTDAFMSSIDGLELNPPLWRKAASDIWGTFWGYKAGHIEQVMDHPVSRYREHINSL